MSRTPRYIVYVIHPHNQQTAYFKEPGHGITYCKDEAHQWTDVALGNYIDHVVGDGGDWGTKQAEKGGIPSRILQVWVDDDDMEVSYLDAFGRTAPPRPHGDEHV